jgi:hypothetical protein
MGFPRRSLCFAALFGTLAAVAGCGGGVATSRDITTSTGSGRPADFQPKPHQDSGGGAAQFRVEGGDNSVQEYGAEAPESELRQAAADLHGFLDARAERNWAAACAYLSAEAKRSFAGMPGAAAQGCAASLAALAGQISTSALREAAVADVGSLRAEGDQGFLLYRGAPKGTVYAIKMVREAGRWMVASLSGVPLN